MTIGKPFWVEKLCQGRLQMPPISVPLPSQGEERRQLVEVQGRSEKEKKGGGGQGKFTRLFIYNTSEQKEVDITTRFPLPLLGWVHSLRGANGG